MSTSLSFVLRCSDGVAGQESGSGLPRSLVVSRRHQRGRAVHVGETRELRDDLGEPVRRGGGEDDQVGSDLLDHGDQLLDRGASCRSSRPSHPLRCG